MDSGGSFYMTPRRDFLFDFKEFNGGTVLLGDNRACAIKGTGKVIKGSLMVLSGTIKENYVYSLDGWAESGEASVGIQEKESLAQVWHKRLGHISEAGLHELKKKEVLGNKGLDTCLPEATVTAHNDHRSPSTTFGKIRKQDTYGFMVRTSGELQDYPEGVKGYRLWRLDDVKPKIIISRDVVFNESLMYKDTLKGAGAADSGKEVEFEVELQGSRVEPTVDPHTGENPGNEDEEQDEGPQQQNLDNYVLVRDRAKRTTTIPARYRDEGNVSLSRPSGSKVDDMAAYAFAIAEEEDTHEPITFQEAINSSEKDEWVRAMEEEMSSLKKNHTWELVDQPPGQKLVSCKWLYKIKEGIEGVQKPRYKARLVARGFTQRAGIDYNEVFSPVVRHTSIRVILSLTACEDYELEQLDVKTAFLHGNLEETIYMRQPPGFEEGTGNKVCLLKKSLYGLKQSPRQWYKRFDVYMVSNGFSRSNYDSCVYFKEFAPGPASKILGMEIVRDRGSRTLKVSQSGYVQKILNNYRMDNGKSVSMPLGAHFKKILNNYRMDNGKSVSVPLGAHFKGTADVGLVYGRDQGKHMDVDGFVDADYAKDPDKETEYMALTEAVKESIWLKGLLIELGVNLRSVIVNCDNQSAIHLSRNAMFHKRTKHINVRYHFIREIVKSKEIEVAKIGTKDNAADAFTKVVPGPKFKYCMEILGIRAN
ncbi:retrovirus-related pol polyprotein from transposon TNT 1-94 [Tanacetum coccineum]